MADIGKLNKLRVIKITEGGVVLDGIISGEIFLSGRELRGKCNIGDILEVFIYLGAKGKIEATAKKPYAMVGQVASLKVKSVNSVGAFLDWGLQKDLLVPFSEQSKPMVEGRTYIVAVYYDEKSGRIAASQKVNRYIDKETKALKEGEAVEILIFSRTELGYKAVVNNTCWGVLYKNEIFQTLIIGQTIKGFIKKVRDDGKIDLCLHKPGYKKVNDVSKKLLSKLEEEGGYIALTDKSSPELIYKMFGVSKQTFKKGIGALYRKKIISIEDNGIRLIPR